MPQATWPGGTGRLLAPRHRLGQRQAQDRFIALGRGVLPLICGDVIRPSLPWLLFPETPKNLAAEMARSRDPGGFAALAALARTDPASAATKDLAARRIAAILAAKGGVIADITVGDCLELLGTLAAGHGNTSPYFYQLLHTLGVFPPAPRHRPGVRDARAADHRAAGRPLPVPAGRSAP